jgi:lipid-binding SYLF domain-containing protein
MSHRLTTIALAAAAAIVAAGCSTSATTTAPPPGQDAAGVGPMTDTTRREVDAATRATMDRLFQTVRGSRELVGRAQGVLVFPRVIDAGLVLGAEYGIGQLRIGPTVAGYYRIASGSIGAQIGAQSKAMVFLFMTPESLARFRSAGASWSAGADASVAVLKVGANGEIDLNSTRSPTIGFVMTNAGLMADASLEATRISRIE